MEVAEDFVCSHGMPKPWVTCIDCMELPYDEQPRPPRQVKPKPQPKPPAKARKSPGTSTASTSGAPRSRKPVAPRRRLPRSATDELPELVGEHDLAYEIAPSDLDYHIGGPDSDWLPISSLPSQLRSGGYVYLQVDEELVARAQVHGVGYRERRWDHAAPEVAGDLGPGATLELAGWAMVSIDLGADGAVPVKRFRYLTAADDGPVRVARQPDA